MLGTAQFPVPATKVRTENFLGHTLYGVCNYFKGQISQIILYTRAVNDSELVMIEAYLQRQWPLPTSTIPL